MVRQAGPPAARSAAQLAEILGVSERRVREFIGRGMPVERDSRGRANSYPIKDAVLWCKEQVWLKRGDDALLEDDESPALERYRTARAEHAELDLAERCGELIARDKMRVFLGRLATVLRGASEVLQRQFGAEAYALIDDAIADYEREVDAFLSDSGTD